MPSLRQRLFYTGGRIGGGVYDGFNTAILNLYLGGLTNNNFIIGYLSNSKTMEGVVIQPLVGRLSDRTTGRLGRRKPFILFGAPLSALFLILAAHAGHTGGSLALPLVALAIVLFSIVYNVAGDPYDALMVDITPPRGRATFNAVLNIVSLAGYIGITLFASIVSVKKNSIPDSVFYITAAAIVLGYAFVLFGVREPADAQIEARREERIPFRAYLAELRTFSQAFKFLLADFFFWNGIFAMLPFLNRFMTKTIGVTDSEALRVNAVLVLVAAICAYPAARLGLRFGYTRVSIAGCAFLIASALFSLFVRSYGMLFPLAALAGCGYGTVNALLYPYLARLVPESKIGVFTGTRTAFSAIATPLAIGVTTLLTLWLGYRSIFLVVSVTMAGAVVMFATINVTAAEAQVQAADESDRRLASPFSPVPAPAGT
jgi:Na+/melibiose symporter-like transporter